jgi:hypothetical protein
MMLVWLMVFNATYEQGRRGCDCDHMVVGFTTAYVLSITTNVLRSIPTQTRCTQLQHYVIKFFSDVRQVGGFLWVIWYHDAPAHNG